jgi:ribonucleotide monophosphatase NagD (HAD superfamily)
MGGRNDQHGACVGCKMSPSMQPNVTIEEITGQVPVQAHGTMADGRHFYFRARYDTWALHLGPTADAAVDEPTATWSEPWGDTPFGAGYMEEATARTIIESCAEMFAVGAPPPQAFAGLSEEAIQARRFAKVIVADICSYQLDELIVAGAGARIAVASQIEEGRALFREHVAAPFHEVYEAALAQLDVWAQNILVHDQWLTDPDSARSVGRRWACALVRTPASRREAMKVDAVRWLTAWTPPGDVREAWQAQVR